MSTDALDVAFICTGNRFRSPLAAALLAAERPDLPLRISSYGTLELGAARALVEAVEFAAAFGADLSAHRSASLAGADLEDSDLVLGFERHHLAAAVVDAKARPERTFTLPELVGLLANASGSHSEAGPVQRARSRIQAAHRSRPPDFRRRRPAELADPLGRPRAVQEKIAEELRAYVFFLASHLFD